MLETGNVLCIDLGTSSIRAAFHNHGSVDADALELGEAFRSSIDRASIPSAVFVGPDLSIVEFGERALAKGLRGERAFLFNASPKAWMNSGPLDRLRAEVLPGTGVTPRHLLAGLLAQGLSGTRKALPKLAKEFAQIEIRVAHPVWNLERSEALHNDLAWISSCALRLAGITDNPVAPEKLLVEVDEAQVQRQVQVIDVVEPVAAALLLFENSENSREACVVVDVGAGSTDMAIFLSLTPDARGYRRKFIRAAAPKSVYLAGDHIDREVIDLIRTKASRIKDEELQSLELRRRQIKETLFGRVGKVYEAGVEITLRDLEHRHGIRSMQDEVATAFQQMISESSNFLSTFTSARAHRVSQLDVIFAGGGSNIGFLHQAIGKAIRVDGRRLPIRVRPTPPTSRALPAMLERLAVALGGTIAARHWPVTSMQPGEWTMRRGYRL